MYGHFLTTVQSSTTTTASAASTSTTNQPSVTNSNIWLMTLTYMTISILQDHKLLERIPTLMAINIIKHVLKEINTLPPNLTTTQVDCINKGKELINLLLLGSSGDGAGVVSHYDIILAVSNHPRLYMTIELMQTVVARCVWSFLRRHISTKHSLDNGKIY